MSERDALLAAILRIHAAGNDATLWPDALASVTQLIGGAAATFEVFDKASFSHRAFHAFNIPPAEEIAYLADYISNNPRWVTLMPQQKRDDIGWDYQFIDEAQMNREPFYAEFLPLLDMRYFLSGIVAATADEYAVISVQRTKRQGHAGTREIDLMRNLVPHVRQAFDVGRRLNLLGERRSELERALDWLADAVLMVASDGRVRYANAAALDRVRRADGIGMRDGTLLFGSAAATSRFARAMKAVIRLADLDATAAAQADFIIERDGGMPPLAVSLRPLPAEEAARKAAAALMFVHDPLTRGSAPAMLLREAFGLTAAEADMATALCAGIAPDAYAQQRQISRNTVYTHLRRIKEKTGCTRLPALIRKLDDVWPAVVKQIV